MANVAVLACANAVGLHQRMLTDSRHRRTFTHIRSYIESRVKLENERQQQVSTDTVVVIVGLVVV